MGRIPKASISQKKRIMPSNVQSSEKNEKVLFSFESVEKNEYFNLDATCQNWSADLFDTMQQVSKINIKDIYVGKYSGKNSPLRIHQHANAKPPCEVPQNISMDDMWQIRISLSKGGIHGVFSDNTFYVVWFDPHHNLYPDKNHGGSRRIIPPLTCCKERDQEIAHLKKDLEEARKEIQFWEACVQEQYN